MDLQDRTKFSVRFPRLSCRPTSHTKCSWKKLCNSWCEPWITLLPGLITTPKHGTGDTSTIISILWRGGPFFSLSNNCSSRCIVLGPRKAFKQWAEPDQAFLRGGHCITYWVLQVQGEVRLLVESQWEITTAPKCSSHLSKPLLSHISLSPLAGLNTHTHGPSASSLQSWHSCTLIFCISIPDLLLLTKEKYLRKKAVGTQHSHWHVLPCLVFSHK